MTEEEQLEQNLDKIRRQIEIAQNRNSALDSDNSRLSRANAAESNKLLTHQAESKKLEEDLEVLRGKIIDDENTREEIKAEIEEKKTEFGAVKRQLYDALTAVQIAKNDVESAKNEESKVRVNILSLNEERKKVEAIVTKKKSILETFKVALENFINA